MDGRKQAVSIRLNAADIHNVKRLAQRLAVRDSDIIRFAVKAMLRRLAPLQDLQVRGRGLVPVFVESGNEIFRYFELDASRLDCIINEGAEDELRVDHEDIQLIAMSGIQQSYARLRLTSIGSSARPNGNGRSAAGRMEASAEEGELNTSLRRYLYEKYVYRSNGGHAPPLDMESKHEG
ncbi:MAG TPA: hypothetical protein VJQ52_19940 [Steroidobacteraceae bacterium]|nr:hypothetical protein [Steroidobacteraceae bacterium]